MSNAPRWWFANYTNVDFESHFAPWKSNSLQINHIRNLVFYQIIQTRFKLCILPFGFKTVNDKFSQLRLEKGYEFKWGGHLWYQLDLHVGQFHHLTSLWTHFQVTSKGWIIDYQDPLQRDMFRILRFHTYYIPP